MNWSVAFSWCAVGLFLVCCAIVAHAIWRERRLKRAWRNTRVTNREVRREQITMSLPASWMKDFADREYHDE
jgi:protein-S-isoprenylcysteine O-methyltransferase Ste14